MQSVQAGPPADSPALPEWRILAAGLCASLVGIGLARFAYTPLLPAIINAHWFPAATAAYLGAANLAGYLAGALLGVDIARRTGTITALRLMMLLASAAFFACAIPVSFLWFFLWRFVSGVSGGALMVLAATSILPFIRPSRRGLASGVIFMGVGLGVAASGTIVPLLLHTGLAQTWLGLGAVSLLLTLLVWTSWPQAQNESQTGNQAQNVSQTGNPAKSVTETRMAAPAAASSGDVSVAQKAEASEVGGANARAAHAQTQTGAGNLRGARGNDTSMEASSPPRWQASRSLPVLYALYGLNAVGLVAHMVFLVDYVARGLGWGVNTGSAFWVLYGLGAVAGPLACGAVADRIGYARTLRGSLLLQLLAVVVPIFTVNAVLLGLSSIVIGAFTPGIVPLVLGRLREMLPESPVRQRKAWSRATASFALMQAAAAYVMSFVFAMSGGQYTLLFVLAAAALTAALVISIFSLRHSVATPES